MDKNGVVTFSEWNKGQVKHPIYGFGLLQNVEVFENKGIAGNKTVLQNQTTWFPGVYLSVARIENYELSGSSLYGELTSFGNSLATGLANPWDMILYKDYIWVRYGNNLGAYGPLSVAPQWFPAILTSFDGNFYGKIIQGQDGYLYSTSGNEVVKLDVTSYGTPGTAPSVSISATLDLPDGQYAVTLEELGTKIAVGTQGKEGFYNTGLEAKAKLYTWNRLAGTLGNPGLADLPVLLKDDRINAMVSYQNKLYISGGTTGNIYISDGTNYIKIATLPYTRDVTLYGSRVYPNAMTISNKGTLLIGLSSIGSNSVPGAKFGVYEIDITDPKYPVSFRSISTLVTDSTQTFTIGFVRENFNFLEIGWQYGTTYGFDSSLPAYISVYPGIIETQLIKVGSYNNNHTFPHLEWSLATPFVIGQGIRIYYRKNSTDGWTLIGAWANSYGGFDDVGATLSYETEFGSIDLEYVQLRIELYNDSVDNSNIDLVSVRVW